MSSMPPTSSRQVPSDVDTLVAGDIKALLARGETEAARERFEELVARHQRRAARIAYHYLRDGADVDEAVQDAFVKAFVHLPSFRQELPFVVWFTRIIINGCLDRLKARSRRGRWMIPLLDSNGGEHEGVQRRASRGQNPEELLLTEERRTHLRAAIHRLPHRQQTVLLLGVFEGYSTREVSAITGVNEATVRVHQFRAIRSLRKLLGGERWMVERRLAPAEVIHR